MASTFLKRFGSILCDRVVGLAPYSFVVALNRRHREVVVANSGKETSLFKWDEFKPRENPQGFEDLTSLFWNTSLNRGLLRQDFDEAATLFRIVRSLARARGVEIGRFHGASTLLLAVAVGPEGRLISIDVAPQDDLTLLRVLTSASVANRVNLIVGDANEVSLTDELDFVFIDGDHSYDGARRDHNRWGKLVRTGGFIIHHDMANQRQFATQWSELKDLRENILNKQAQIIELVEEVGSMSVFRRKAASWADV